MVCDMNISGMRRLLLLILATSVLSSPWLLAAETEAGKQIAMQGNDRGAPACLGCHGVDGGGNAMANFPRLAGMNAGYLAKQLQDFASGVRANPIMQPIASALNGEEIEAVSSYYTGLQAPQTNAQSQSVSSTEGKNLVELGDWNKTVPACIQCHGPGARGVGMHFPTLAGQHAGYIESQLQAWRQGTRKNDPNQLMLGVAERLDEDQIKAVSVYLSSLRPTAD